MVKKYTVLDKSMVVVVQMFVTTKQIDLKEKLLDIFIYFRSTVSTFYGNLEKRRVSRIIPVICSSLFLY